MVSELKLKGLERDIYAIIFGFCQNEEYHKIYLNYFMDWTNSTSRGCRKAINSLVTKNLILVRACPGKASYYNINPNAVKDAIRSAYDKKAVRRPEPEKNNSLVKNTIEEVKATPPTSQKIRDDEMLSGFKSREELRDFLMNSDWTYHGKK